MSSPTFTKVLIIAVTVACLSCVSTNSLLAEEGIAPRGVSLEDGMPVAEVLKRWGPPKERIERESKRQDLWRYANSEVLFENGKVKSWDGAISRARDTELTVTEVTAPVQVRAARPMKDETVKEILNELQGYGGASSPSSPSGPEMGMSQGGALRPTPMGMYPGRPEMNMPPD